MILSAIDSPERAADSTLGPLKESPAKKRLNCSKKSLLILLFIIGVVYPHLWT